MPDLDRHATDGPIHLAFGLTYASYLTLPRTLLQSMTLEWQERFVVCLDQFHAAFAHVPQAEAYEVTAGTEHVLDEMSDDELRAAGVEVDHYGGETPPEGLDEEDLAAWEEEHETEPTYHQVRTGREMEGRERVILPGGDPVPHYNRGRTYIEPVLPVPASSGAMTARATLQEELMYGRPDRRESAALIAAYDTERQRAVDANHATALRESLGLTEDPANHIPAAARTAARTKLKALIPGQLGLDVADEVADHVRRGIILALAELTIIAADECPCVDLIRGANPIED